jgi:UDP:flavonoid glycosyltransferase YjiC (YdhE family)
MSRVLLAWELGRNLGHLSRLLPVASRLKARGHTVLVSARDLRGVGANSVPPGVAFVQSPVLPLVREDAQPVAGYADLLWSQGWSDPVGLGATLKAWINLYRLYRPEVVVLDYSPTARLAAHVMQIPTVLIGTGFELPPAEDPLPLFPGHPLATPALRAAADRQTLEHVNAALTANGYLPMDSLSRLVEGEATFLTTIAELDHYPARAGATYVGPIADSSHGLRLDWPSDSRKRVFAYLRPEMRNLREVLEGLRVADVSVIAYAPGIEGGLAKRFESRTFQFAPSPVQYDSVLRQADICISYGPAGTVAAGLLRGVPQLILPMHVESQLTSHRVESLGVGRCVGSEFTSQDVSRLVTLLSNSIDYKLRARSIADRYRSLLAGNAVDTIVAAIEQLSRARFLPQRTDVASTNRSCDPLPAAVH